MARILHRDWRSSLSPSAALLLACAWTAASQAAQPPMPVNNRPATPRATSLDAETSLATFGAGCFWCVEAVYERIDGVVSVSSGFAGGTVANPTYQQVCTGATGHAEVCQIRFDPARVTYAELLEVFFKLHDPTTANRQGHDHGSQYRSVIFCHDAEQLKLAKQIKEALDTAGVWRNPIVTEIAAYTRFYPAEAYHQDYFSRNSNNRYCSAVIRPKLAKLEAVFADKLKQNSATSP